MKRIACPWCRAEVLCDDATRTTHHPAPPCAGYERAVARQARGGAVTVGTSVIEVGGAPDRGKGSLL
jgi:hypothetical protein